MLDIIDVYKAFNPGTINEKVALNGLNLTLNEGDFVTVMAATVPERAPCSTRLPAFSSRISEK